MENSSLILIGFVVSKAGVGVIDNKIGAKEIETKTEIKTSKPLPAKKKNGVMYQPSELAQTMRKMYVNMQLVNAYLDSNHVAPDSVLAGYESMLRDTPTNPEEIGPMFHGFANGWLSELETFKKDQTLENYIKVP